MQGFIGIDESDGFRQRVVDVVDGIADECAIAVEAADLETAGDGAFGALFAELDAGLPGAVGAAECGEFINAAQGGLIGGGDEVGAHAPYVDFRPLVAEAFDEVLVEIVPGDDGDIGEAGGIEAGAGLLAEPGEVAGIKAYAAELVAALAEAAGGGDGAIHAGEGIVGVDEQGGIVRHGIGVAVESFLLVVEGHDP